MLPLTNASRRPVNFPTVPLTIIVVNVAVFILERLNGDAFVQPDS